MKKLLLIAFLSVAHFAANSQCNTVPSIVQISQSCNGACNKVISVAFSGGTLPLQVTLISGAQPNCLVTVTSI